MDLKPAMPSHVATKEVKLLKQYIEEALFHLNSFHSVFYKGHILTVVVARLLDLAVLTYCV